MRFLRWQVAAALVALSASPAPAADITGAGSTFVAPLLSKWSADYAAQTGAHVIYHSIGSGGGIAEIKAGTVDFGASDAPLKPRDILTDASFRNAITADMAIGGSTNAIIHLVALAGRAGIRLELRKFDEISQHTPMIANIRPSGEYLMEDFYYAGGLRALLKQIRDLLDLNVLTVSGETLERSLETARVFNDKVLRSLYHPVSSPGGTAILYGNLAPDGAVIKPTAAERRLLKHVGPAVVFKDYDDLVARIDDEALPVDRDSVLVLQNAGPLGGPGMPEWGMLPIPRKLLAQGRSIWTFDTEGAEPLQALGALSFPSVTEVIKALNR